MEAEMTDVGATAVESPSMLLAQRILERLVKAKILTAADRKKLVAKLAAGKLTSEDWGLAIEVAQEKGG